MDRLNKQNTINLLPSTSGFSGTKFIISSICVDIANNAATIDNGEESDDDSAVVIKSVSIDTCTSYTLNIQHKLVTHKNTIDNKMLSVSHRQYHRHIGSRIDSM